MDVNTRAEYENQSQQLRIDLKTWETDWAKAHEGKKPGRGDIKACFMPTSQRPFARWNLT